MSQRLTTKIFLERVAPRLDEYEVLSPYVDATVKMKFRCKKCGREFMMKPHLFMAGRGCRDCSYRRRAVKKTKTLEDFIAKLPAKYDGYIFTDFTGATAPVTAQCPKCGRVHHYSNATTFTTGLAGCRSCNSSRTKPDKELQLICEQAGFVLLGRAGSRRSGKYEVSQVRVKCKKCGKVSRRNVSNLSRSGCKYCNIKLSKHENEIFEWVKNLCPDAVHHCRSVIDKELDIWVPSAQVAIEYNGTYWHCAQKKEKEYHYEKSVQCRARGVRLIHVWEYEWKNPRQQAVLKNIILGALHKLPERYYARDCEVKSYTNENPRWAELNDFFVKNNIQGNRGGKIVFTLEKEGRILMAYKFGTPSGGKAKQKFEWEMVRGASAPGVQVVGGATRLWRHFVKEIRPKSVVYYVDFNYFDGVSVEKLGGVYKGHTQSYKNYWVHKGVVKNREPRRHKEVAAAEKRGEVYKIWNAGVLRYEFQFLGP